ncbi:MAG: polymer-forming cytoskeletal protein [Rhodobiaceae bacterium]|nr:polymer-forming cytoskeletal protein [Rhodobiaceae bacterium]
MPVAEIRNGRWRGAAAIAVALCVLALAQFLAAAARAEEDDIFRIGARINVVADGHASVWAAGGQVSVLGVAKKDVWVSGGDVEIDVVTEGDLSTFGGGVELRGRIGQDAAVAGANVEISANIGKDLRIAGATVLVADSTSIDGVTAIYAAHADFRGEARGDLRILADEVVFSGHAEGAVILQGRKVRISKTARIDGDVTVRMLGEPVVEPGATIGGQLTRALPRKGTDEGRDWGLFTNISIAFAASAFVIAAAAMFLGPAIMATAAGTLKSRPALAFVNGLVAAIGGPIVAGALILIVVTAPLGLFLFMAYPLLALLGHGLVGFVIGDRLIALASFEVNTFMRLVAVAVGVSLVSAVGLIPFVGLPLVLLILVSGVGAVLLALAEHLFGFATKRAT